MYINMQLELWLMLWEIGQLSAGTLRTYATDLLQTSPGRRYWARFGPIRMSSTIGAHRERKFLETINDEYLRLAPEAAGGASALAPKDRSLNYVIAGAALLGVAFALGRVVHKINQGIKS
jgi:hypothetical protein